MSPFPERSVFFGDRRAVATTLILIGALLLCLLHLFSTAPLDFTHDIKAHVPYIKYIVENHTIPKPYEYWEFYQPPLYYVMAALVYMLSQTLGMSDPLVGVCFLSLGFYAVYCYFVVLLLKENIASNTAYALALAIIVFWPNGINMARNINNDVPLFTAETAGFYYLLRWWNRRHGVELAKACLWAALSINFKSNGLIFGGLIGAAFVCQLFRKRTSLADISYYRITLLMALSVLLAAAPLARSYYYYRVEAVWPVPLFFMAGIHTISGGVVPQEGALYISNGLSHYLSFDMKSYLTEPFYNVWKDEGGREYFWNAVLKTSLFDEFTWKDRTGALVLSVVELLMIFYLLASAVFSVVARSGSGGGFFLAGIAVQLTSLMAFCFHFPVASHQEFRFIFAATVLFGAAYAKMIDWHHQQGHQRVVFLGVALGIVFTAQSILMILRQDLG